MTEFYTPKIGDVIIEAHVDKTFCDNCTKEVFSEEVKIWKDFHICPTCWKEPSVQKLINYISDSQC